MTSAYVLIFAILLLGALLATLGDRLGSKIGKARLRLFNLRPRQTAVVVTVITGIFISASTLGILFALSKTLRQGVFDLDKIQKQRRQVETELSSVTAQKEQVEQELLKATEKQQEVNLLLTEVNTKFQTAQAELDQVSENARKLGNEVKKLVTEREQLQSQRDQLKTQINQLEAQSAQLKTRISELQNQVAAQSNELLDKEKTISDKDRIIAQREQNIFEKEQTILEKQQTINQQERDITKKEQEILAQEKLIQEKQAEINRTTEILLVKENELQDLEKKANELEIAISNRDQLINQLDQQITLKDQELQTKETELQAKEASLQELQTQLEFLKREVAILEQFYQNYQVLRQGNVALLRGQVLAFAAVKITRSEKANDAIDQLLSQANRNAIKVTQPLAVENLNQRVVQITNSQVQQLIEQINDGQEYVVRILSAGNYVQGENQIRVFADVAPNELVYQNQDLIATVSLDSDILNQEELEQKLDLLLAATRFRARRAGILGDIQVEDGSLILLINFLETLNKSEQPIDEVRAIASERTFSAGPLKIRLLALKNSRIIHQTSSPSTTSSSFSIPNILD
jgi:uncharacterized protein (DUF3084 family)